jgi:hypothetical protein
MRGDAWPRVGLLVVLLAACGSAPTSVSGGSSPFETRANGNFRLYVSNQSFALDPVDITIRIDGRLAVSDDFAVGNEHNWKLYRFDLAPGMHRITAVSRAGRARLAGTFRVRRTLSGVVDYWYSPGNPGGARKLTFHHSQGQIAFA